jgi:hypothetical protein
MIGTMDDPMTGERNKKVKYVTRLVDADNHVFEMHDLSIKGRNQEGGGNQIHQTEILTVRSSQLNNSAADRDGHGLRPIGGPQFLHDVFDVDLNCVLGDEEVLRNITVAVPAGDLT